MVLNLLIITKGKKGSDGSLDQFNIVQTERNHVLEEDNNGKDQITRELFEIKTEEEVSEDGDNPFADQINVIKEIDAGLAERCLKNDKRCEDCGIQINHRQNLRRHTELSCLALGKILFNKKTEKKEKIPV